MAKITQDDPERGSVCARAEITHYALLRKREQNGEKFESLKAIMLACYAVTWALIRIQVLSLTRKIEANRLALARLFSL